jgi:hypothetical protein
VAFVGLAAGILTFGADQAFACRCRELAPKVAHRSADSAVLGKIISVEDVKDGADELAYVVEVYEWWKAPVDSQITVHTSTTCRFEAQIGTRYVLFLKRDKQGRFETAKCMGNSEEKRARHLLKFLRSTKPRRRD